MKTVKTQQRSVFFILQRHINKLRWLCLSMIFMTLILLPLLAVYQNYVASHSYDLLTPNEKNLYDTMAFFTAPFTDDPKNDLDAIKGTTWSGQVFDVKMSDPLAVAGQMAAGLEIYWPFIITALIPIACTMLFGRIFCGWICPATLLYELNTNLGLWLERRGLQKQVLPKWWPKSMRLGKRLKYGILAVALVLSTFTGSVLVAAIYPPAIIGREIYFAIALSGFSVGTVFFLVTLFFDLLVARRGFCRYLCPGGALYSLLGRFRLLRIQRKVSSCNDCEKCTSMCEFELDPMRDDFGQECNNCTACIAACPTDALVFSLTAVDQPHQGPGHLGHAFRLQTRHASDNNLIARERT